MPRRFSFFSLLGSGTIGRLGFLLGVALAFTAVILKLEMSLRYPLPKEVQYAVVTGRLTDPSSVDFLTGITVASDLLFMPLLALAMIFLTAQRLRDLGVSGWYALASLIPLAFPLMAILLMVLPGSCGAQGKVPAIRSRVPFPAPVRRD